MNEFVTIRTFSSSIDFEMVKSYLESFGIECYGQDEIINRVYIGNVNGGVKLQVKAEKVQEAIKILMGKGYLTKKDFEPTKEMKWVDKLLNKFRK